MPRIALVEGVAIILYTNDHNPPHVHARLGDDEALVNISDAAIFKGSLPRGKKAVVEQWVADHRADLLRSMAEGARRAKSGTDCMSLSYEDVEPFFGIRIKAAEAVTFGVLKISWSDDVTGIVDLRPMIGRGDAFAVLQRDPERFTAVRISEGGHSIFWLDDDGNELDFGADQTRAWSEKQAALIALAS